MIKSTQGDKVSNILDLYHVKDSTPCIWCDRERALESFFIRNCMFSVMSDKILLEFGLLTVIISKNE